VGAPDHRYAAQPRPEPAFIGRLYAAYPEFNAALRRADRARDIDCYDETLYRYLDRHVARDASIVELGCGDGRKLRSLLARGYTDICGCDPLAPSATDIDLRSQDAMVFLETTDRTFDFVILNDVLEHLSPEEICALLTALAAHAGPGTAVYVHAPNGASPFGGLYQYGDLTHRSVINELSIHQIACLTPFAVAAYLSERSAIARYTGIKRQAAMLANLINRSLLAMVSYLIFRRKTCLMPNLICIMKLR